MAFLNHIFLGILILQIYVHAAPSDVSKLDDIAKVDKAGDTPATTPKYVETIETTPKMADTLEETPKEVEDNGDLTESSRQKRQFYNPYGYGFPPISKLIYPSSFNNRNNFEHFGPPFGADDPLSEIHRRVQEIASIVRQPPAPSVPQVPIFFPVLFVPPFDCACNPTDPPPSVTTTTEPPPNVTSRFPEMEDERQNWGLVDDYNKASSGQDFSRPISFDPIKYNPPNARPPPPVEHGTVQSGSGDSRRPASENESSGNAPAPPPPPSTTRRPPPTFAPPVTQNPFINTPQRPPPRRPPPLSFSPNGPPTPCDGAILTCCHQPQVVYDCFAIQGCSSFTPYGNPCETNAILRVIEKFQSYYDQRNG